MNNETTNNITSLFTHKNKTIMSLLLSQLTNTQLTADNSPNLDSQAQEDDDDAFTSGFREDDEDGCCPSESFYLSKNRIKRSLFVMLVGIKDDNDRVLGNTETSPYKDMKLRKCLVPTSKHYRDEIDRRCFLYSKETHSVSTGTRRSLSPGLPRTPL